jgi:hypothetical protein
MLLRHFSSKLAAIARAGASIEEFTLTQPVDSAYDFRAANRPPIDVVAVIANDRVQSVYRILGVEQAGSNRAITSTTFRTLDGSMNYPERQVKRFRARKIRSALVGRAISGWSSPRTGVARAGGKLFERVQLEAE